jgi:hypothetical protein
MEVTSFEILWIVIGVKDVFWDGVLIGESEGREGREERSIKINEEGRR